MNLTRDLHYRADHHLGDFDVVALQVFARIRQKTPMITLELSSSSDAGYLAICQFHYFRNGEGHWSLLNGRQVYHKDKRALRQ